MNQIVITLNEKDNKSNCYECAHILIEEETGVKTSKRVTVESMLLAFSKSLFSKNEYVKIGKVPFGFYDGEICMEQGKLSAKVVAVLPASQQIMTYEETRYDVCVPSLVFQLTVERERLTQTMVFALKDKRPTDKSRLYTYPFGNVNTYSGIVCWGRNQFPKIDTIKKLEEIMTMFIQSPCNSDHFRSKDCCGKGNYTLRQLFEELRDKKEYPEDYLVIKKNDSRIKTMKDLLPGKKSK